LLAGLKQDPIAEHLCAIVRLNNDGSLTDNYRRLVIEARARLALLILGVDP
jgi:hypothetical protein